MVHPDACMTLFKFGPGGTVQAEHRSRAKEGPKPMEHGSSSSYSGNLLGTDTYMERAAEVTGDRQTTYKVTDAESTTTTTIPTDGSTSNTAVSDYGGQASYSDPTAMDARRIDMYGLLIDNPVIGDYGSPVLTQLELPGVSETLNIGNLLNPAEQPFGIEKQLTMPTLYQG